MNDQRHIVVGYHPSQASLCALAVARNFGILIWAEVHVVHGIDIEDYPADPDAADWEEEAAILIKAEKETVKAAMADYPGAWQYHEPRGGAYNAICQVADKVEPAMIVLGYRGASHGRLAEHIGGLSLARRLLNGSGYPVLLAAANARPS